MPPYFVFGDPLIDFVIEQPYISANSPRRTTFSINPVSDSFFAVLCAFGDLRDRAIFRRRQVHRTSFNLDAICKPEAEFASRYGQFDFRDIHTQLRHHTYRMLRSDVSVIGCSGNFFPIPEIFFVALFGSLPTMAINVPSRRATSDNFNFSPGQRERSQKGSPSKSYDKLRQNIFPRVPLKGFNFEQSARRS